MLLVDPDWQFQLGLNLGVLQFAAEEIRALDAPQEIQHVHNDMLQMADAMDEGATLFASGVDNLNVDLLELAITRFSEVNRLIESTTAKTLAICQ